MTAFAVFARVVMIIWLSHLLLPIRIDGDVSKRCENGLEPAVFCRSAAPSCFIPSPQNSDATKASGFEIGKGSELMSVFFSA
jgi:hypothetical protein